MTTFRVRVEQCRFPLHGLDLAHVFPPPDSPVEGGPIVVSRLDSGEWFVQDGRHRVIRARLDARQWIDAVDHDHVDEMTPEAAAAVDKMFRTGGC